MFPSLTIVHSDSYHSTSNFTRTTFWTQHLLYELNIFTKQTLGSLVLLRSEQLPTGRFNSSPEPMPSRKSKKHKKTE